MKSIMERYRCAGDIGRGAFSRVLQAMHKDTAGMAAIKIVTKSPEVDLNRLRREVDAFRKMRHPNIVSMFEVQEDDDHLVIVLDFVERGSLKERIDVMGRIEEGRARRWFSQLVRILDYLHNDVHIVHRDLKSDNILIDDTENIKLADFGLCNFVSPQEGLLKTNCGTPTHVSPEVIKGQPYGPQTDLWSLGVILYNMLTGTLPFLETSILGVMRKVVETEPAYPETIPPLAKDLIKRLLVKDPGQRLTLAEVKSHPWISEVMEMPTDEKVFEKCLPDVIKMSVPLCPLTGEQIAAGFENHVFDETMATPRILLQRLSENYNRFNEPSRNIGWTPTHNVPYSKGRIRLSETLDFRRRTAKDTRRKGNTVFMLHVSQRRGIPQASSVPKELFQLS